MGSSRPPAPWHSCIPFQGSKVLEGEESLLFGGYEQEHLSRILSNGRVDCELCRETGCDPCSELTEEHDCDHRLEEVDCDHLFELIEELDSDHRFWLGKGELDCDDLFRLDSIWERLLWLASCEQLMLEVDERHFLGRPYDHLSGECEDLFSSMSNGSIFSEQLSTLCMKIGGSGGISGVLQDLWNLESLWVKKEGNVDVSI